MKTSASRRMSVWAGAIVVLATAPHLTAVILPALPAKEVFDMMRAKSRKAPVPAYLRAGGAGTCLSLAAYGASRSSVQGATVAGCVDSGQRGACGLPRDDSLTGAELGDAVEFLVERRADWLGYAAARTRCWQDAEDVVSHVATQVLAYYQEQQTLCPAGYDPEAYWKRAIANYIITLHRQKVIQDRFARRAVPPQSDFADDVLDQMIAEQARRFLSS